MASLPVDSRGAGPAGASTRDARLVDLLDGADQLQAFERGVADVFGLDADEPLWAQLDSVQRALLLRLVSFRRPDVALEALQATDSLADVHAWVRAASSGPAARGPADPSILRSGLVHLREWRQDDLPTLYRAATAPGHGRSWHLRGTTPSFRDFASGFGAGTLATLVVATNTDDEPVGTVAAYSPSLEHGWVYVGFQGVDRRTGVGLMLEGMLLFVTWLFDTWNLRKVYAEISPALLSQMRSLEPDPLRVEGRLSDHVYEQGAWRDVVILSVRREAWTSFVSSVAELVKYQAAAPVR